MRTQAPALPVALRVFQKLWSADQGECAQLFQLDYFICTPTPWRPVDSVRSTRKCRRPVNALRAGPNLHFML